MILEAMMPDGCLLDTSFFIRLLNERDSLFKNADGYFRYLIQKKFQLYISTISIAEYCVYGSVEELPLKNLLILPFNFNHALQTSLYGKVLYDKRKAGKLTVNERPIIINDAKLFAQAEIEKNIKYFVTADTRSFLLYNSIKEKKTTNFDFINIKTSYNEIFSILEL